MQPFPHRYHVLADACRDSEVTLQTGTLPAIRSAPPVEFGGPGNRWSPETLLVAAVADCFILTFKAIARASRLDWQRIDCAVSGVLDQQDRQTRFTHFDLNVTLVIGDESLASKAEKTLVNAEKHCLVTASLSATVTLDSTVTIASGGT